MGMMTLVAIPISVAFFYSVAVVFGLKGMDFFWELATLVDIMLLDGTVTTGLNPEHINMLTPLFAFAPDTKITKHPVSFGTGDWTAVVGEMEGTFSKPMDMVNGKIIQPTGKKFKLSMSTIGHWKDGKMIEEHLHWDNQSMMKQIGL